MIKLKFVGFLATLQTFLLFCKGLVWAFGGQMPWVYVLAPTIALVAIAFVFWLVMFTVWKIVA